MKPCAVAAEASGLPARFSTRKRTEVMNAGFNPAFRTRATRSNRLAPLCDARTELIKGRAAGALGR